MVGITVIIPTVDRDSFVHTCESLDPQKGDEVFLVVDGPASDTHNQALRQAQGLSRARWTYESTGETLGAYGHGARNFILDRYRLGGHFWSLDDDDIAAPNALNTIRTAIESFPGAWFIFQMEGGANSHWHGLKVPHSGPKILPGNVGTPCIVWPASAESRWGTSQFLIEGHNPGYYGDYQMAASLHRELGDPVWIDEVIAIIRP